MLLGECAWRSNFDEIEAVESLLEKGRPDSGIYDYLFHVLQQASRLTGHRNKYAGRVRFLDVNERYGRNSYDE